MKTHILFISFYLIFVFLFAQCSTALDYSMEESFDDGDFSGWIEYASHNSPLCNNSWSVENGRLVSRITQLGCSSNLFPIDSLWKSIGSEYEIDLDMWIISGIDHNFNLRFDPLTGRFYEYHFQAPNSISLGGGPPAAEPLSQNPRVVSYPIPARPNPYKIKIIYRYERVELYVDDVFVHKRDIDVTSVFNFLPEGRMSLRASSGAQLTETWFDNISVTSLNMPEPTPTPTPTPTPVPEIALPYFSQSDPLWDDSQYDSISNSISELGCALTATAMVLKYYGIDRVPDGNGGFSLMTPLSLNKWLVDNKAYSKNGGLVFPKIASLSKDLIEQLNNLGSSYSFDTLEYHRLKSFEIPINEYERIDRYLTNYLHPLIFKERSTTSSSGSHFVVATKVISSGQEYKISDPVDSLRTSLLIPPSELQKIVYFRPANSDLSYLFFQFDAGVDVSVLTPMGLVSSENSATESASIGLDLPITNEADSSQFAGKALWEFDYKYPPAGEYLVSLNSLVDGFVQPWMYFFDKYGGIADYKNTYFVSSSRPTVLKILYDPEAVDSVFVIRKIFWDDVLSDITSLERIGAFKNHGTPQSLRSNLTQAMNVYPTDPQLSLQLIDSLIKKIESLSGFLFFREEGKTLLIEDLGLLKSNLE